MLTTRITTEFGLSTPILNAGMALVARPRLAAAVSNAGGLGMLGVDVLPPEGLASMIRETRALTARPFGIDLLGPFISDEHIDVAIEERVALLVAFWGAPSSKQVGRIRASGTRFWMQVGSLCEAQEAVALGADAIIVQGAEAGGHNRSEAATFSLLPAVRAAVAPLPVIAAGGIVDGRGLVAALALGAEAVWCGTRFLASEEADAHEGYKARVVAARVGDTLRTTIFGPEWPDAPLRVIGNAATREFAGREADAVALYGQEMVATLSTPAGPLALPRFSAVLPTTAVEGDLEQLCLTAGESAGNIASVRPAAAIVEDMTREAAVLIGGLHARVLASSADSAARDRAA